MKRETLDKLKEYALSNFDLKDVVPEIKIFTYPELQDATHIDELLDNKGRAIMLFLTEGDSKGHWIAILRHGNKIEMFDPYGHAPDTQDVKLGGSREDNERWGQNEDMFKKLVKKSGYGLVWNSKKHQPDKEGVNTCGRHSLLRILFHKYTLPEYNEILQKIKKETSIGTDDLATYLTAEMLEK